MKKSRGRYTAVYRSTVTGLPATVLLSGKNFMVGTRYTAVKLYRGIGTVYRSTVRALIACSVCCLLFVVCKPASLNEEQKNKNKAAESQSKKCLLPNPRSANNSNKILILFFPLLLLLLRIPFIFFLLSFFLLLFRFSIIRKLLENALLWIATFMLL